jgi:hypothetical protein
MDFSKIANEENEIENPYAGQVSGDWIDGIINANFLNTNFGEYNTATEMKNATDSEGLKKFFDYLVEQGELEE